MKKFILFSFLTVGVCEAQDVSFNNTDHTLVYMNPSFAGSSKHARSQSNYRLQWPNLSASGVTYQSCLDGYIKPLCAGIALGVMGDDQARGTLRTTGISLTYAQYLQLSPRSKFVLVPSIQVSYGQQTLDKGRLNYGDLFNMRYGMIWNNPSLVPHSSVKYNSIAAGLMLNQADVLSAGVSVSNINQPNIGLLEDYKLPMRTTAIVRYKVNATPTKQAWCTALYLRQKDYYNFRYNVVLIGGRGLSYGLGYSVNNRYYLYYTTTNKASHSVTGFFGYTRDRFAVLYSYNRLVNKNFLDNGSFATHELSLNIVFAKKRGD